LRQEGADRGADGRLTFNHGQSYLARANASAIYNPELPLRRGLDPGDVAALLALAQQGLF
jgi:hypothetical protein